MRMLCVPSGLERRLPAGRIAGILPALISQYRGRLDAGDTAGWKPAVLGYFPTVGSHCQHEHRRGE